MACFPRDARDSPVWPHCCLELQRMAKDQAQNLIESASTPLSCVSLCVCELLNGARTLGKARLKVSGDRALITFEKLLKIILEKKFKKLQKKLKRLS